MGRFCFRRLWEGTGRLGDWFERLVGNIWLNKAARNILWIVALLCGLGAAWAKGARNDPAAIWLTVGGSVASFAAILLNLRVGALSKGKRISRAKRKAAVSAASNAPGGVIVATHYDYPAGAELARDIREVFKLAGWKVQDGTRSGISEATTGITLQRTREGAVGPEFAALEAALLTARVGFDYGSEPDSNSPGFHGSIYVGRPRG